ncbi:MAG: NAD(+)/NADH kinase [Oscillospiraceae bacterium]|nr:NAD(+)/NADH kinase [Oscillospiraceae bacterium]
MSQLIRRNGSGDLPQGECMLRIAIFPNFQKKNALPCAVEVCRRLHVLGGAVYLDTAYQTEFAALPFVHYGVFSELVSKMDIVIAIGGDGTMLRCAKQMIGSYAKLLGINTGHLGFMAGLETDELDELGKLFRGEYFLSQRMMIEGTLYNEGEPVRFTALNDIAVSGLYGKVFDFSVYADDALIGRYRADGVVCSTPTGSTAYALSAGGPLMEPELSCMEIALICPHSLFNRPLLLSADRRVTIRHTAEESRHVFLSADGEAPLAFPAGSCLNISRSVHTVGLISLKNGSFYDAVNRKLMQSIKGFSDTAGELK